MLTRSGCAFIVLADVICWGALYWLYRINALPTVIAISLLGVLFGCLMRLDRVMTAPSYNRAAAHRYANMACATVLALVVVVVFWL